MNNDAIGTATILWIYHYLRNRILSKNHLQVGVSPSGS